MNTLTAYLRDCVLSLALLVVVAAVLGGNELAVNVLTVGVIVIVNLAILGGLTRRFLVAINSEASAAPRGFALLSRLLLAVPIAVCLIVVFGVPAVGLGISVVMAGVVLNGAVQWSLGSTVSRVSQQEFPC